MSSYAIQRQELEVQKAQLAQQRQKIEAAKQQAAKLKYPSRTTAWQLANKQAALSGRVESQVAITKQKQKQAYSEIAGAESKLNVFGQQLQTYESELSSAEAEEAAQQTAQRWYEKGRLWMLAAYGKGREQAIAREMIKQGYASSEEEQNREFAARAETTKKLQALKEQGLTPVYVKGELTGFEDIKNQQSVSIQSLGLQLEKTRTPTQLAQLEKAGVIQRVEQPKVAGLKSTDIWSSGTKQEVEIDSRTGKPYGVVSVYEKEKFNWKNPFGSITSRLSEKRIDYATAAIEGEARGGTSESMNYRAAATVAGFGVGVFGVASAVTRPDIAVKNLWGVTTNKEKRSAFLSELQFTARESPEGLVGEFLGSWSGGKLLGATTKIVGEKAIQKFQISKFEGELKQSFLLEKPTNIKRTPLSKSFLYELNYEINPSKIESLVQRKFASIGVDYGKLSTLDKNFITGQVTAKIRNNPKLFLTESRKLALGRFDLNKWKNIRQQSLSNKPSSLFTFGKETFGKRVSKPKITPQSKLALKRLKQSRLKYARDVALERNKIPLVTFKKILSGKTMIKKVPKSLTELSLEKFKETSRIERATDDVLNRRSISSYDLLPQLDKDWIKGQVKARRLYLPKARQQALLLLEKPKVKRVAKSKMYNINPSISELQLEALRKFKSQPLKVRSMSTTQQLFQTISNKVVSTKNKLKQQQATRLARKENLFTITAQFEPPRIKLKEKPMYATSLRQQSRQQTLQIFKPSQSSKTSQRESISLKNSPIMAQPEITKFKQPQVTRLIKPSPFPEPTIITPKSNLRIPSKYYPLLERKTSLKKTPYSSFKRPRISKKQQKASRRFVSKYLPSMTGNILHITSSMMPSKVLGGYGFGIRPLIVKRKKRKN